MSVDANVDMVLSAVPAPSSKRLQVMGWPAALGADLDRSLRRAIGAATQVNLVDLELDPERWHGVYLSTSGMVGWSRDTTCLGRIWLEPELLRRTLRAGRALDYPPVFQARVTGVLLADATLRAAHRERHHSQGGYGRFGLFIAALCLSSVQIEVVPTRPSSGRASSLPPRPPGR